MPIQVGMRFREMICSPRAHAPVETQTPKEREESRTQTEEIERFLAEVRAQLSERFDLQQTPFMDAVVWALANDFDAGITGIGVDQWLGVSAAKDDGSFFVSIECDFLEHGFAGVYRAFARHAKIMAVLDAVPGATWAYTVDGGIGTWSLDGAPRVILQRDGHIAWVGGDTQARDASPLWTACAASGFTPQMQATTVPT